MFKDDEVRLIGIRLDNLTKENIKQISLFQSIESEIKDEKLDKTLDDLKSKYGKDIIKKAGVINLKDKESSNGL